MNTQHETGMAASEGSARAKVFREWQEWRRKNGLPLKSVEMRRRLQKQLEAARRASELKVMEALSDPYSEWFYAPGDF
jgi:hypothetical protein